MQNSAASPKSDVAIVSDSSACLPEALLREYDITVVPLALLIDSELYHDGQLSPAEFRSLVETAHRAPTTTAPAPGEFLHAFRDLYKQGKRSILCLTLSSAYSGTHSAAVNATDMALREMPDLRIVVLDTGGLAMAHGFAVLEAARAVAAGADVDEAAAVATDVRKRSHLVGALDTTLYLAKSGRVPWIVHWAASLLQVKPVLVAHDGRVRSFGRPRTTGNAIKRLVRYVEQRAGPPEHLHVAVAHYDAPDRAAQVAELVRETIRPAELIVTEFTPVMSVHAGPGFVGLAFYSGAQPDAEPVRLSSRLVDRDIAVLEKALGDLPPPVERPAFFVLSGLPGAGKTKLAGEIAARTPVAVLESDRLRKVLFERPAYTQRESGRLFNAIHGLLDRLLAGGIPCLLDATNIIEVHRRTLYEIAERRAARLVVVSVETPHEVALSRLAAKMGDEMSDADAGIYEKMRRDYEPIAHDHLVVDGTGDAGAQAERVVAALAPEVRARR
jgi:DegV family protein with EDD domain